MSKREKEDKAEHEEGAEKHKGPHKIDGESAPKGSAWHGHGKPGKMC